MLFPSLVASLGFGPQPDILPPLAAIATASQCLPGDDCQADSDCWSCGLHCRGGKCTMCNGFGEPCNPGYCCEGLTCEQGIEPQCV